MNKFIKKPKCVKCKSTNNRWEYHTLGLYEIVEFFLVICNKCQYNWHMELPKK